MLKLNTTNFTVLPDHVKIAVSFLAFVNKSPKHCIPAFLYLKLYPAKKLISFIFNNTNLASQIITPQ